MSWRAFSMSWKNIPLVLERFPYVLGRLPDVLEAFHPVRDGVNQQLTTKIRQLENPNY